MSEVCRVFEPVPQILRNVRFSGGAPLEDASRASRRSLTAETALGATGRLVIRKSGTEPVIRVMAEGEDAAMVGTVVNTLIGAIERVAGN